MFWVRTSGDSLSLDEKSLFLPQMAFFESVAPMQPAVMLYAEHRGLGDDFHRLNLYSTCGDEPFKQVPKNPKP